MTGRRSVSDDPRSIAYDVLTAVSRDDAYANLVLPKLLRERGVSGRDAAFATELAYGASRARGTLDAIIASVAGRPVTGLDQPVADVLRLGAYQVLYTRVPAHAAVGTAVSLVRRAAGHRPAGFVNAVMRKIAARPLDAWLHKLTPADEVGALALKYAHPEWIVSAFRDALGGDKELPALLAADNTAPAVHLCARPGLIGRDELAAATGGRPGALSPYAVILPGGAPGDVAAVAGGRAHVQDEGSQVVALRLAEAPLDGPDARWLDLCAGPGGKAALLGSLAALRDARLDAVEVSAHRARLVEKAVAGLPVTVHEADGRTFGADGTYDRVLVDAPCTGLGALRRRPEARWRREPSDVPELAALQRSLLASAVRLTRPGGLIGYVTCSPHLDETRAIAEAAEGVEAAEAPVQLWPHRDGTDAMYLALLRRVA
ncbi:putative Fmu protein [Actinorhabdospora filicis]|uniref:Fmu protein n=1 Tax=Actinorhabdospora filicis TaxID=1785913 RepID=A0A9W6SFV9_9ACTN|nr:transcription antitermination factor NusB [Actinorhabdospora filicis]GLZ75252.1 putative Fmu protein [Actinorhabdospora filicis]